MQSTIIKSLTVMLTFLALIFVSACSEEQHQAAKNTADTVAETTDAVENTTSEAVDSAKQTIQYSTK